MLSRLLQLVQCQVFGFASVSSRNRTPVLDDSEEMTLSAA